MYLKRIVLRDWKAYANAQFDFPAPTDTKNVTLIGAINGYGKTSLFEALVLGLFGRHGLPLIARAPFSAVEDARLNTTYGAFLSGALHKRALDEGRSSCSVELSFDDAENGPLILKRAWHFVATGQAAGQHKPGDEELVIFEGPEERPVRIPPSERDNDAEWLRAYIARKLLPHTLAHFFLFDGEQVQALAKKDMGVQVRMGIEGLLGIPVLRELAEDLRQYASQRRTGQGAASDQTIKRIESELITLEMLRGEATTRLSALTPELENSSNIRDQLTQELGSFSGGSVALLREKQEELQRLKQEKERLWERLSQDLAGGVAMALVGKDLRGRASKQLIAEGVREEWIAGRAQVERRLEPFLEAVKLALQNLSPSLEETQQNQIQEKLREAFETLWHPAPEGNPDAIRHSYLSSPERALVCDRLAQVEALTSGDLADLVGIILSTDERIRVLDGEVASVQGIAPQLEEKVAELNRLNKQMDLLSGEKGKLDRDVEALSGQIAAKRQELARYTKSRSDAAPALRRANRADLVAESIDLIIRDGVPGQIGAVAESMTDAWKAIAHKTNVQKVDIDVDCNVRLLARSGRNMRELDLSAGEQQIFALALISAVAKVSGRDFPVIVDTPLARLDKEHRLGVLRHFTEQSRQVILLSTDTEVVDEYFNAVRGRVANSYLLKHEHDGDVGHSWPVPGYFKSQEI